MSYELEVYINYKLPNWMASAIQAIRVAGSFAKIGVKTTFFYRNGDVSGLELKRFYGVSEEMTLHRYPGFYISGNRLPLMNDLISRASLMAKIVTAREGEPLKILYGRNPGGYPIGFLLALRAWFRKKLPLIVCEAHQEKDWIKTRIGEADVIVAISEGVKRDLVARRISEHKIIVAHDGVDLSPYDLIRNTDKRQLRAQLGLPANGPLAIFTGHLYRERGMDTLVEAVRSLPGVTVVFVGGFPEDQARVREQVVNAGIAKQVIFVGQVSPSQISRYQMAADILLLLYRSDLRTRSWCSPMKLFEYMATGVPMIASDLPVLHEVVEDEKEVLFVPPDDPQALTKAMRRLLENPDVAQRIGRNALLRVKEFTWERRAKRIYDFIGRRFPEYTTED